MKCSPYTITTYGMAYSMKNPIGKRKKTDWQSEDIRLLEELLEEVCHAKKMLEDLSGHVSGLGNKIKDVLDERAG